MLSVIKEKWAGLTAVGAILVTGAMAPGYVDSQISSRVEKAVDLRTNELKRASQETTKAVEKQRVESEKTRKLLEDKSLRIEKKLDQLMLELIKQKR